jgi:Fe2+ transport system protein B
MAKPKLNSGHYLEIVDRLHVMASNINDNLLQHPACKIEKEISKEIDKALTHLYEAYQIAGKIMFEKFEKDEQ